MNNLDVTAQINSYKSHQNQWERLASIRSKPRRLVENEVASTNYFPLSRQPLCAHPEVERLGKSASDYILTQTLYKYMNDIANIEKDIINKVAYNITKDAYCVKFSFDIKQDALSIIIDESYHAFVALDFMNQVAIKKNIPPITLPTETELSLAIQVLKQKLPEASHPSFDLITVCIAEHALTNDLISTSKSTDVSKIFYYVMHDHVLDEGRHAVFFTKLLTIFWLAIPEEEKMVIGPVLPELLGMYMKSNLQRQFDEQLLLNLAIPLETVTKILDETHVAMNLSEQKDSNIVLKQMLALLKRTAVLDHPATKNAFLMHGLC